MSCPIRQRHSEIIARMERTANDKGVQAFILAARYIELFEYRRRDEEAWRRTILNLVMSGEIDLEGAAALTDIYYLGNSK